MELKTALTLQAVIFSEAAKLTALTPELRGKLLSDAQASRKEADIGEVYPTLLLRNTKTDEYQALAFGPVQSDYKFPEINGLGGAAAQQTKEYMDALIGRARAIWAHWAKENSCSAVLDFDRQRLVLQFSDGSKKLSSLGFTLANYSSS